jgi:aminotransferase
MVFPGAMFGDDSPHYIRIGYLQPLPVIQEAMRRIADFVARRRTAA